MHASQSYRFRRSDIRQRKEEFHSQHAAISCTGSHFGMGVELSLRPVVRRLHYGRAVHGTFAIPDSRQRRAFGLDRTYGGKISQRFARSIHFTPGKRVLRLEGLAQARKGAVEPECRACAQNEAHREVCFGEGSFHGVWRLASISFDDCAEGAGYSKAGFGFSFLFLILIQQDNV